MPDYKVTINVKDVAKGDIKDLVDAILEAHGESFDAANGEFVVTASERHGDGWFAVDLDENE